MPQTRTSCPRCRQPVMVDLKQLFDVGADPKAKQEFLSGAFNFVQCNSCGYQGGLATPLVFHDPAKELLLTYFPPELGVPILEQEKMIGPMINLAVNRLPAEKRKAYLLRPQTMLTLQSMVERVLEGDGITKEMLQDQQKRLALLQRLMSTPQQGRSEIIRQEENLIDESFFSILNRLMEATMAQGDQNSARQLASLQQELLSQTEFGRGLQIQAKEAEAAIKSLQEASQNGLTREKLLDLIIEAPTEDRLNTLASFARSGLDYNFFQMLSDKIDHSPAEEKQKLTDLRDKLLLITQQIDEQIQNQLASAQKALDALVSAPDLNEAIQQMLPSLDDYFIDVLKTDIQATRNKNDLARLAKLQEIAKIIQEASAPPPEIALIEELLSAENEAALNKMLTEHASQISPEFLQILNSLMAQSESQGKSPEVVNQLRTVYRSALRFSMETNLKKN